MLKLDILKFIDTNTFFSNEDSVIKFIQDNSDENFGEDHVMYYFNKKGYNITFVYDESENCIISEQLEITFVDEIKDNFLKKITYFEGYKKELNHNIDSFYLDECGEKVVFMNNGINAHFNDNILSKMTSKNDITRNFIIKFMKKVI